MRQHRAIYCCFRHAAVSITHETHFLSVVPFLKARSSKCGSVKLGSMQRRRALLVSSGTVQHEVKEYHILFWCALMGEAGTRASIWKL